MDAQAWETRSAQKATFNSERGGGGVGVCVCVYGGGLLE